MTTEPTQTETAAASQNDDKIHVKISETTCFFRWPCGICGGSTDRERIVSTFRFEDDRDQHICQNCLDAGSATFCERLLANAERRERHAAYLRELAEHEFVVPAEERYQALHQLIVKRYRGL